MVDQRLPRSRSRHEGVGRLALHRLAEALHSLVSLAFRQLEGRVYGSEIALPIVEERLRLVAQRILKRIVEG